MCDYVFGEESTEDRVKSKWHPRFLRASSSARRAKVGRSLRVRRLVRIGGTNEQKNKQTETQTDWKTGNSWIKIKTENVVRARTKAGLAPTCTDRLARRDCSSRTWNSALHSYLPRAIIMLFLPIQRRHRNRWYHSALSFLLLLLLNYFTAIKLYFNKKKKFFSIWLFRIVSSGGPVPRVIYRFAPEGAPSTSERKIAEASLDSKKKLPEGSPRTSEQGRFPP